MCQGTVLNLCDIKANSCLSYDVRRRGVSHLFFMISKRSYWHCCVVLLMFGCQATSSEWFGSLQWSRFPGKIWVNQFCIETLLTYLTLSVAYIRRWTGSTLLHVMACRLFGPKPLPDIVGRTLRNKVLRNSNRKTNLSFKNMHLKMSSEKLEPFCAQGDEWPEPNHLGYIDTVSVHTVTQWYKS